MIRKGAYSEAKVRGIGGLFAIDPGTEQSALVQIDAAGAVGGFIRPNAQILALCRASKGVKAHLVVEQIASYGMPVGAEVFDTCVWIGRFVEAWEQAESDATWSLLPRKAVKLALCGTLKAKDPHIRQALMDRFGGPQSAKKGGPLAGIKSHLWSALAVAITYQDQVACEKGKP